MLTQFVKFKTYDLGISGLGLVPKNGKKATQPWRFSCFLQNWRGCLQWLCI